MRAGIGSGLCSAGGECTFSGCIGGRHRRYRLPMVHTLPSTVSRKMPCPVNLWHHILQGQLDCGQGQRGCVHAEASKGGRALLRRPVRGPGADRICMKVLGSSRFVSRGCCADLC